MTKADKMFVELGFTKNKSECYNDQHVMYEKSIMNGTDILTVEFKDGQHLYTSLHMRPIWTSYALVKAIETKLRELGWI